MIKIAENVDLLPFNTFHLPAIAKYFVTVKSLSEIKKVFADPIFKQHNYLILGGGSNILLTKNFDGFVIKNEIKGIEIINETDDAVTLRVGSGEEWHEFVMYCVDQGYGGVENLSLIPGTCGAAPMQNIGAYGIEVKEVVDRVEAIEVTTGEHRIFTKKECKFGYRESIFKNEVKGRYFISSITLSLTKKNHRFNTSYGSINDLLKQRGDEPVTIKSISEIVIHIRQKKLPDPKVIGNAGSFFKNPSVDHNVFTKIKEAFPTVPSFPGEENKIKIPAAWLIEQCGWKGKTLENIGVHKDQALVLVNYGGGEGEKIWKLATDIQRSVKEKFQIDLSPEVNII